MGMAASQARLLTITARLNHVELEAQNVSNAKIRLSDKTQEASDEYIEALNKTEYLYNYYDGSGEKISMSLTGAALTTYGELKNQYGLINSAGQILVSELDAKNYESSNTLEEFLEKYGVLGELGTLGTGDMIEVTNPEYETAMDEYDKEYDEWMAQKPDPDDDKYKPDESEGANLYDRFMDSVTQAGCWEGEPYPATSDSVYHISHILTHMLEYDVDYTAYPDESGEVTYHKPALDNGYWGTVDGQSGWNNTSEEIMKEVRERMAAGEIVDKDPELLQDIINLLYDSCRYNIVVLGYTQYDGEKYYPDNGQEIPSVEELATRMQDIIDRLRQQLDEPGINEDLYNEDLAEWQAREPQEPDVPQFIEKEVRKITDLDKAQWYVNLWHRMNGTSDYKAGVGGDENFIAGDGWATKSKTEQSYAVLKDGDMNSPEYLKFAIENGLITLEQVQFIDPSKSEEGVENIEWTSIVFSAAQDITEQKDEEAITKAEVKYEQAQRDLQAKDKNLTPNTMLYRRSMTVSRVLLRRMLREVLRLFRKCYLTDKNL